MTVQDMIYLFIKDLETIDKILVANERPDTTTIVLYLNKAKDRFIRSKYLSGKTIKENAYLIQQNSDDLINLIKRTPINIVNVSSPTDPYYGCAGVVDISSVTDYYHYIRSDSLITRSKVVQVSSSKFVPNELINYDEVEFYLTTPYNYPILPFPRVIFQEENLIYIIKDMDTTFTLTSGFNLTYLRKHKILVDEYTRTACFASVAHLFITGDKVIITKGTLTYPTAGGTPYGVGDILTIVPSQLTITFTDAINGCLLGNYNTETLSCELAEYCHEDVVHLATSIYLDELKLKLVKKQPA